MMKATYLIVFSTTEKGNPMEYHLMTRQKDMRTTFCKWYKDNEVTDIARLVKAMYDCNVRVKKCDFEKGAVRLLLPDGKTAWEFRKAIHGIWKGGKR